MLSVYKNSQNAYPYKYVFDTHKLDDFLSKSFKLIFVMTVKESGKSKTA